MRNSDTVEKMIATIDRIIHYIGNISYEAFCNSDMLVDACVFNLSQLGEQANKISVDFEEQHPEIPWRQVYGLRNRIVHDYEGINLNLIW